MFSAPQHEIKSIVILGGGTAGWMTAAALSKLLPAAHYHVTLVESDAIGTVGVGEATLPHLRFFNQRLGIDEAEFIQQTNATFKVGIEFSNWGQQGDAYIHPFGDYGFPIHGIPFHHFYSALKQQQPELDLDRFSLPVMACKSKKFAFPSSDPSSLSSTYSYAYHIDAGRYAAFLRRFAESNGVTRKEGKMLDVITRVSDNQIDSLVMDSGEKIKGDFFIDCSGFRGQLIEQTLASGYEDWSHWLPCNSAIAIPSEHNGKPLPYTKAIARDAGWQWQIPLQHRMGNGYVYCDSYINQQQALDTLEKHLPGKGLAEPNYLRFSTGKRKQGWKQNCVAIGLSSGFLEPLESTSIYLIQAAIMKLVELLPQRDNMAIKRDEFNRYFDHEMVRIRDFLILHYHATERDDTEFWRYCRDLTVPDSLSEKLSLFQQHGFIDTYQYGLFLEPSWVAVYFGQRQAPSTIDPRVKSQLTAGLIDTIDALQHDIDAQVKQMPLHADVLKQLNTDYASRKANQKSTANAQPAITFNLNQPAKSSLYGSQS